MKHFNLSEFDCSETGENNMDEHFLILLDTLRDRAGFPFIINSGFRSVTHSVEAVKKAPGKHTEGIASDIEVSGGRQRYKLVKAAMRLGFTGIGVAKTFVHVDTREDTPMIWSY